MRTCKVVFFLTCFGAALAEFDSIIVHLNEQGSVRGYKDAEGDLYSFLNVPYATAPTGTNKFKAPLPPPIWTETFDAVDRKIICYQQPSSRTESYIIQENCLVANIYVPDTNRTNLPVLVVVHGGAYQTGAGAFSSFTSLARTKEIIVVTFNYRLGVHGFLCLGTDNIPGNAALKDQLALLRWVNKNIGNFGGNADDVTISGCSAGGGSVDFLTISPRTAGLFNKAIIGSGTVFGGTGPQMDPLQNAKIYAQELNFADINDTKAMEEFYTTASYEVLFSGADYIMESDRGALLLLAPCIERNTGSDTFLHEPPVKILTDGTYQNVTLLYGFSEMEGLHRMPKFDQWSAEMNAKFSDFLPTDLAFESDAQKEEVADTVKHFYFGNETVGPETIMSYIDYFTDVMFAYPILRSIQMRKASLGDVIYLFEYSFVGKNTPFILDTSHRGPGHCDQTQLIQDEDVTDHSDEYITMKHAMRELWFNFITTGNPTPEGSSLPQWPAVDRFMSPFMSLNARSRVQNKPLLGKRGRFWDDIYGKHAGIPIPPP